MENLTQKDIADCLNVKQSTISKYKTGKSQISLVNANILKEKLNIPFSYWLGGSYLKNDTENSDAVSSADEEKFTPKEESA